MRIAAKTILTADIVGASKSILQGATHAEGIRRRTITARLIGNFCVEGMVRPITCRGDTGKLKQRYKESKQGRMNPQGCHVSQLMPRPAQTKML